MSTLRGRFERLARPRNPDQLTFIWLKYRKPLNLIEKVGTELFEKSFSFSQAREPVCSRSNHSQ